MKISASRLWFDNKKIYVELNDKRIINVPLSLYPKLKKSNTAAKTRLRALGTRQMDTLGSIRRRPSAEGFLKYQKHVQD